MSTSILICIGIAGVVWFLCACCPDEDGRDDRDL